MVATIIILALIFMDLGAALVKNGQPKTGEWSFWHTLLADGIMVLLMWQAGIFDNFK